MKKQLLSLLSFILAALAVQAHSVWIEPKDNQLVVRFAEPGAAFETSPGYLDALASPLAFTVVTNKPVTAEVTKKSDHFVIAGGKITKVTCVETAFTVRGGRKPYFYARWQPNMNVGAIPLLTFDLVPTGKIGEVRAYFRGQALPAVSATLRLPDGKEEEITADSEGFLHFKSEQPGQYLLTIAHHREPLAGFHQGVAYTETSHNCALSWMQP
jgi:hypothetical protein